MVTIFGLRVILETKTDGTHRNFHRTKYFAQNKRLAFVILAQFSKHSGLLSPLMTMTLSLSISWVEGDTTCKCTAQLAFPADESSGAAPGGEKLQLEMVLHEEREDETTTDVEYVTTPRTGDVIVPFTHAC